MLLCSADLEAPCMFNTVCAELGLPFDQFLKKAETGMGTKLLLQNEHNPLSQSADHRVLSHPDCSVQLCNEGLTAGSVSLQVDLWRFALHTGVQ